MTVYSKTTEEWLRILKSEGAIIYPDTCPNSEWLKINDGFGGYFQAAKNSPGELVVKKTRDRMAKEMRKDGWTVWVEPGYQVQGRDTFECSFSTMRKKIGM